MTRVPDEPRSFSPWRSKHAPERALIIRMQAMGDVAVTLPACSAFRQRFPGIRLDYLTSEVCAGIVSAVRTFDHVYTLASHEGRLQRAFEALLTARRMHRHNYDLVVDLQRHRWSRIIRRLARPLAWGEFDRFSPKQALERTLDTFHQAGFPDLTPVLRLDLKREIRERSYGILKEQGWDGKEKLIVLNPAGLWLTKRWPLERYAELADLWSRLESVRFLLLGTDKVYPRSRYLAERLAGRVIDLVQKTTVAEAMGILQYASVAISEDSGLFHMAWVSGIPTVALFGSTRSDWTRPLGKHSRFVGSEDLPCGACMEPICRLGDVPCLSRHSADTILRLAREAERGE